MKNRLGEGDSVSDLTPYWRGGVTPECPAAGADTVVVIGMKPTCAEYGRVLP